MLDKADIAYFRSLSPTGDSQYGGWAKFPAAFGRKAALKQAGKFAPKDSEVSIILTADDTERGIEIPDEIMNAVGARMLREMVGDDRPASGEPPPETQHSKGQGPPRPGDATKLAMPGRAPQPSIADATDDLLFDVESKMRASHDANKWPEQWRERNVAQLATIRAEMRRRGLAVTHHAFYDGEAPTAPAPVPENEQQYDYDPNMREPGMEG